MGSLSSLVDDIMISRMISRTHGSLESERGFIFIHIWLISEAITVIDKIHFVSGVNTIQLLKTINIRATRPAKPEVSRKVSVLKFIKLKE